MKIRLSAERVKQIIKEEFHKLRSEAKKPDFLYLDKDGNKEEPMEDAAEDKEEEEGGKKDKKKKDLSKVPPQLRKSMEKKNESLKKMVREEILAALK